MKKFFSRNRRAVEIILTLSLVLLTGGYYYLIYIPERENQIIERRFRTLQMIEENMQDKFQGYLATIKNCFTRADETFFDTIVQGYNTDPDKFHITIIKNENLERGNAEQSQPYDSLLTTFNDNISSSFKVKPVQNGKKLTISYEWYKYKPADKGKATIKHIIVEATIDYKEFVVPLLRKNVFDQYIVFNVCKETSNIIYEDFHSGISFQSLDSLFDAKERVYSSRITRIETGGEKYLAFLHPCGYNQKNERILVGLLKEETFGREKRQLPERIVTAILFIALFSFLLLPVIRLALMGKRERIRLVDLFSSYFSFLLLVPVVILVFFWNNKQFIPKAGNNEDSKKVLASQIAQSLNNEIASDYLLLDKIDSLHCMDSNLAILDTINVRYLNHTGGNKAEAHYFDKAKNGNHDNHDNMIVNAVHRLDSILENDRDRYRNSEYTFWMDHNGKEIANWSFGDDPPRGNYKGRNYFKDVQDNNVVSLDKNAEKNYAIEPVISRIDGKFKVVMAKRSREKDFVVVSPSRFSSVMNPVLPLGFSFTIADADGKAIFDSDSTHNLNENMLDEFTDPSYLKIALDTKTSCEFETRYEDEHCNVLVQPIGGLPYFIVILEKQSFESSLNTQCFSFTMVMMFSFFLILCLEIIILLVFHHQQTKLLKNRFDFSWIHPRESLSHKYSFLFLFNSSLLIVLALFCFIGFSIQRLNAYIFLFIMAALLSSIAACAFKADDSANQDLADKKNLRKRNTMIALLVVMIIVICDSFRYSVQSNVLWFLLVAILIFIILNSPGVRRSSGFFKDYLQSFRLMIFSRLLLTSGLPVIVFFACIYNFEQRLEERLKLLDYAQGIKQYVLQGGKSEFVIAQLNNKNATKTFYTDAVWINRIAPANSGDVNPGFQYSYADSVCIRLLKTSRIRYNDVSGTTENFELLKPFGNDSDQFVFNSIFNDSVNTLNYRITEFSNNKARRSYITLSSSGFLAYAVPLNLDGGTLAFWLLLICSLIFCYKLLKYAINKIFGKSIPGIEEFKLIHEKLLEDEKVKYVFVQGMPGSNKETFIKRHLTAGNKFIFHDRLKPDEKYNARICPLDEIPGEDEIAIEKDAYEKQLAAGKVNKLGWNYKISELLKPETECVVFTHFEYKILDAHTNSIKLNLIERFIHDGKKKIIISSDIDPVEYFSSMKKFIVETASSDKKTNKKKDGENSSDDQETGMAFVEFMNRWINVLGRFTNIYTDSNSGAATVTSTGSYSEDFLSAECSHPVFLNKYKEQFEPLAAEEDNAEDNILKIQSLSDHSYRQIWSSLTKEEQLTLYDLAEDGLINTTNYMSLTMLLNKGLVIKKDGVLLIMNRSFRNFVLTAVNSGEVESIEKEINDGQTWNDYKYPVLIALGALLWFVLSSNPEKFGNVLPLISGVMAGIPTILKLLSYMKPGESRS